MNRYSRTRDAFKQLPTGLMSAHIVAKFVFGIGIGILLSGYYDFDRITAGWIVIVIALIIAIPSTVRIVSAVFRS
jgi:hypothetical protein